MPTGDSQARTLPAYNSSSSSNNNNNKSGKRIDAFLRRQLLAERAGLQGQFPTVLTPV